MSCGQPTSQSGKLLPTLLTWKRKDFNLGDDLNLQHFSRQYLHQILLFKYFFQNGKIIQKVPKCHFYAEIGTKYLKYYHQKSGQKFHFEGTKGIAFRCHLSCFLRYSRSHFVGKSNVHSFCVCDHFRVKSGLAESPNGPEQEQQLLKSIINSLDHFKYSSQWSGTQNEPKIDLKISPKVDFE